MKAMRDVPGELRVSVLKAAAEATSNLGVPRATVSPPPPPVSPPPPPQPATTTNAIAREHGFWLDDAFASGGSAGYDHKKMGITALKSFFTK